MAKPFPTYGPSDGGSWTVVNHEAEFGPFPTRTAALEFMGEPDPDKPLWSPYAVNETDYPKWFNVGRPGLSW
jgi:hypothetical protein